MSEQEPGSGASSFARVIEGLLRPLVRAMIAQGLTAPALYRIVKRIYVEVAEKEFSIGGERQTDSRISMLTGVHRRDVRDFRDSDRSASDAAREKVTTLALTLGRWQAGAETTDADGRPLPLPRTADAGPSFYALVRSISTDIRPRTILDELERQGLVEERDGLIHLNTDAFLGPADPGQKVHFFAENVGDHIAAAVENLLADRPPFMERAVFYNRLTDESVDAIEAEARQRASDLLIELNRTANDRQRADLDRPEGTHRFRFGVFFYREDEEPESSGKVVGNDERD